MTLTWTGYFVVVFGGLSLLAGSGITDADVEECGIYLFGSVTCSSISYFYRECSVPGADVIHLIKLHENLSQEKCEFKKTFGFRDNSVWVTDGCSGTFYLCYEGVYLSTDRPPVTEVTKRPTDPDNEPDVEKASTVSDNNVWLYILIASIVVLLVGIGLLVGCVVRRRQQNETAKHLAEKRQIRIALREHIEDREENGVNELPLATRSLSMDSVAACEFEKEGSDFSSRSSTSEMTSVSAQTSGNFMRTANGQRSSVSYNPTGRLRKGYSTPDIHALGRMYCEANMLNRQSRNSVARSSQSSLNSIREVCNKYQIFDIPLEKKIRRQSRRSVKFGSVGFVSQSENRASKTGAQTLPRNKTVVSAVVHTPSRGNEGQLSRTSSIKSTVSSRVSLKDFEPSKLTIYEQPWTTKANERPKSVLSNLQRKESIQSRASTYSYQSSNKSGAHEATSHYHDPDSLRLRQPPPIAKKPTLRLTRPESPSVKSEISIRSGSSNPDSIYSKVMKPKPKILLPKPDMSKVSRLAVHNPNNIYATVNKSMFKAAARLPTSPRSDGNSFRAPVYQPTEQPASRMYESKALLSKHSSADSGIDNPSFTGTFSRTDGQTRYTTQSRNSSYPVYTEQRNTENLLNSKARDIETLDNIYSTSSLGRPKNNPQSSNYSKYLGGTRFADNSSFTRSRGIDIDKIRVYGTVPREKHSVHAAACDGIDSSRFSDKSGVDNLGFTELHGDHYLEDDEEDVAAPDKDFIYARMETFKPVNTSPIVLHGLTDTLSHI